MAKLPIASVTRLLRNAGAERVSEDASVALVEILEAEGEKIAAKAVSLAKHAGRKTVKRKDILEVKGPGIHVPRGEDTRVDRGPGMHGPRRWHEKDIELGPGTHGPR
jgi:histone H3/H4